jgi:hypothetical protein
MLNRIVLIGWPVVAACILTTLLKSLDSPPGVTVAVFATMAMVAGALIGAYLDVPEKWLKAKDEDRDAESRYGR